jgi:hypothetical protein
VDIVVDKLPPVELQVSGHIGLVDGQSRKWYGPSGGVDHMIHKANNKHGSKKPKLGWSSSTVRDIVGHALDILDTALSSILVLIVGLRLPILHSIVKMNVLNGLKSLSLSIVTEQSIGGTIITDKIFIHLRDLSLKLHRIACKELALQSSKQLQHRSTPMSRDAIIVSGRVREVGVREVGIRTKPLIQTCNVSSREPRLQMLSERVCNSSTVSFLGKTSQSREMPPFFFL